MCQCCQGDSKCSNGTEGATQRHRHAPRHDRWSAPPGCRCARARMCNREPQTLGVHRAHMLNTASTATALPFKRAPGSIRNGPFATEAGSAPHAPGQLCHGSKPPAKRLRLHCARRPSRRSRFDRGGAPA